MASGFSPHDISDTDSTSFFKIQSPPIYNYGVDLPFDSSRTLRPTIWDDKWLKLNDIKTLLATTKQGVLNNTKLFFDCGDKNSYDLLTDNENFDNFLNTIQLSHTFIKYSGYDPKFPADHFNYAFDRIVAILKFHSNNF